jgi:dipeptidyl aminopeptidase/acylaminoacyl peptidase
MSQTDRKRDTQHWLMDLFIKQTGRYQNYAYDVKTLPSEVKSYKMIPQVLARYGRHREELAIAAEKVGHYQTAAQLYFQASEKYRTAQHAIFENNQEKFYLHGKQLECFQRMIPYAPHPIEYVEIPFEDNYIQGLLHLTSEKKKAPTVVFSPGMDMTKEATLNPFYHPFVVRGMNLLAIDGPGQGTSNIRKIHITLDNYERAGKAALDYLCTRPEVDADNLAVSGYSFGSYWGMQIAAVDKRVKAVGTAAACYGPMTSIFEEETPHFKQVYMYMAGMQNEDEFDNMASQMKLDNYLPNIKCPCLIVNGEYDPLAPLDTVLSVYEQVPGPKEIWVVEDEFHTPRHGESFGGADFYGFLADWIRDALNGKFKKGHDHRVLIRKMGNGPYGEEVKSIKLPERLGVKYQGLSKSQLGPAGIRE